MKFSDLLKSSIDGDDFAIGELVRRYNSIVSSEARDFSQTFSSEISGQDITQEIWIRVCSRLRSFAGSDDEDIREAMFKGWLRTTAKNVARSLVDKHFALKRGGGIAHQDIETNPVADLAKSPSSVVRNEEVKTILGNRVEALPPEFKEMLRMRFFEGLSIDAIAATLGQTRDTVRYRLSKALDQLKDELPNQ